MGLTDGLNRFNWLDYPNRFNCNTNAGIYCKTFAIRFQSRSFLPCNTVTIELDSTLSGAGLYFKGFYNFFCTTQDPNWKDRTETPLFTGSFCFAGGPEKRLPQRSTVDVGVRKIVLAPSPRLLQKLRSTDAEMRLSGLFLSLGLRIRKTELERGSSSSPGLFSFALSRSGASVNISILAQEADEVKPQAPDPVWGEP